jgi:DNA-binding MarR family transcriptional regulator
MALTTTRTREVRVTTNAPDLRSFTGFLLRRAYVRTVGIEQACFGDEARMREIAALVILAEKEPLSQRELALLTHISPTVMVRLVDALEQRGWVTRERKADDRRAYALRLTADGRTALQRLSQDLDTSDAQLTTDLTPDEVTRLRAHLSRLLDGDPALEVSSLAGRTGYLITHAHHRSRELAQKQLASLDLHPRDFGLLAVIGRDQPCSQSHIASTLGVSDPAILPALDALEGRGLLTRIRKAEDRRQSDVRLTPKGEAVFAGARKQAAAIQAALVQRLGETDHEELRGLLSRILG